MVITSLCSKRLHFLIMLSEWKVSVFGVFLARIFLLSDWIRRFSPYSVRMRENTNQKNSEYWQFLCSDCLFFLTYRGSWTLCACHGRCHSRSPVQREKPLLLWLARIQSIRLPLEDWSILDWESHFSVPSTLKNLLDQYLKM